MKTPKSIEPLVRDGLVDEVLRPLKSGKEAAVYVVLSEGEIRCAKVYKDVNQRGFHKQAQYQEGRKVRNSRQARAMEKNSRFGRQQQEEVCKTPKWMRYTVSPPPVCAFRSPTISSKACC